MKLPPTFLNKIVLTGIAGILLTTSCYFQTPSPINPAPKNNIHSQTEENPPPTELKTLFFE
ncbi:MAG: hypothetical protein AABZ60_21265 [Planctomycetota bacterium]